MTAMDKDRPRVPGVLVTGQAPDLGLLPEACLSEERLEPCTVIIFGATGDLTNIKLMPALYNLFLRGGLAAPCCIVGCGRTPLSRQDFQDRMAAAVRKAGLDVARWQNFASTLQYLPLDYGNPADYESLSGFLKDMEVKQQTCSNRVFYLAVPPSQYPVISQQLGRSGLASEGVHGWVRLVVEKPFGRDLPSARELNRVLLANFQERQIFRIDHYMAKETVQNIIMFRFANAIFEPLWNRNFIDSVGIVAAETVGVGQRAGFYEETGVLRDMFQNHMMHLLAVTAMEPPSRFEAERVRDEELKVFRSLKPLSTTTEFGEDFILGQYTRGVVADQEVPGYREEPQVQPGSLTPTFAALQVFVDNWRWRGVPFYLVSGKRLGAKVTQIVIRFKEVPHSLFRTVHLGEIAANRLIVGIYPEEKITLIFETKNPGATMCLRQVIMEFPYYSNYGGPVLEAYEKSLMDVIQGDHMLFWREDAVEACWSYFSPLIEGCEGCPNLASLVQLYPAGTWGPEKAWPILARLVS
jgi:glucose-6-phosphate 1-dehydrogenase